MAGFDETRTDRERLVESLRAQVEADTYQPSGEAIGDSILEFLENPKTDREKSIREALYGFQQQAFADATDATQWKGTQAIVALSLRNGQEQVAEVPLTMWNACQETTRRQNNEIYRLQVALLVVSVVMVCHFLWDCLPLLGRAQ